MKINYTFWICTSLVIFLAICMASCTSNDNVVPPSEYATKIIGSWQGMMGADKETMTLKRDSTFVCEVRPRGFIANTLSQTLPGTIRGTWNINGATITLNVAREKNVELQNTVAASTIVAFKQDSLALKSAGGDVSSFRRELNF